MNMIFISRCLTLLLASVILAGCQTTSPTLIKTQYRVVQIPDQLLRACPDLPKLPRVSTLSDVEVATLISRLYKNNSACAEAMRQIRAFNTSASSIIDSNK